MTRAARKRLGLRRSLGLWLTPAGEVARGGARDGCVRAAGAPGGRVGAAVRTAVAWLVSAIIGALAFGAYLLGLAAIDRGAAMVHVRCVPEDAAGRGMRLEVREVER